MMRRTGGALLLYSALTSLALAHGCGDDRLIGSSCPTLDCPDTLPPVPPSGCGAEFVVQGANVAADGVLEQCQLFTLYALPDVGPHGHVYLTSATVTMMPVTQDVDIWIAPKVDEFSDGPVECRELRTRALPWIPVMTARSSDETWDFSTAPLVTASPHRLLINHRVNNAGGGAVRASLRLQLACAMERPAIVSQAFEFSTREELRVNPGEHKEIEASCNFEKAVRVSRLYRRTDLVTAFTVQTLHGKEVWSAGVAAGWTLDFAPALEIDADDGFRWRCEYDNNMSDLPFDVGGTASDTCTLQGLYQLPDGGEDDSPQRCAR